MPARSKKPDQVALRRAAGEYRRAVASRLAVVRRHVAPVQSDVARRVGVAPNTWYRFETGERPIDIYKLVSFCVLYDIDPRFLLLNDRSGLSPELLEKVQQDLPEVAANPPTPRRRSAPAAPPRTRLPLSADA
jgi:transcriptional regulator with XRE-family HTH domain